jgi:hypothetical protein
MTKQGGQFRDEGNNMRKAITGSFIQVDDENTSYRLPVWGAFVLYAVLTMIFTYPALLHLGTRVIGGGDAYMFLWDIWWFKHALFTLHTNPLINNTIFYPLHNIPMVWSTPVNELGSLPFQFLFGNLVTYNLLILTHFILSGLFMFIFLKKLIKNDLPAFVGGVVYTFSVYHFTVSSGMLGLATTEFIPLFLYSFIAFLDKQTIKQFILMTCLAILVSLSDPYIAIYFLFTFAIVFILYALILNRQLIFTEKRFWGLLLSGVITVIAVSPFYLSMVKTVESLNSAHFAARDAVLYSEDLLGYFIPTHSSFLWGRFYTDNKLNPTIVHYLIGYSVLILGILGIFSAQLKFKGLFVSFLIVTFVLSLGPYLQVDGPVLMDFHNKYHLIPMPYYVIWKMPIFYFLRFPNRYALCVELMLSIFVASGLSVIMRRNISTIIAAVFLSVFIPLETTTGIPFNTSDAVIPAIYKTIKHEPDIKIIYELPSGNEFNLVYVVNSYRYMYYQTYHHKTIVYGHTPRPPNHADDFTLLNPLLQVFSEPQAISYGDIIDRSVGDYIPYGLKALDAAGVSVVLLHKENLSPEFDKNTEKALYSLLIKTFGHPSIDNSSVAMFFVPHPGRLVLKPVVYLGDGWYEPHYYSNGVAYRWMSNDAEIRLSHWKGGDATIEFSVFRPFTKVTDLDVFIDATLVAHLDISSILSPNVGTITIPSVYLHDGSNTIVFHVEQGPFEPFFVQSGFPDVNPYSLAISQVKIEQAKGRKEQ